MKLVLFHDDDTEGITARFLSRARKYKIDAEARNIGASPVPDPDAYFTGVTHIVAVLSPSMVSSLSFWLVFASGFSLGSGHPLLYYGDTPDLSCRSFLKNGIPIKDEEDFTRYLESEVAAWTARETTRRARQALLNMGIPVNEESFGRCVEERDDRGTALFLEAGFSPNIRNKTGVPLLSLAARKGDRVILNLLLNSGAGVNLRAGDRGTSALIDAASGRYRDIVADLLAAGADVNLTGKDGQSALIRSVGLNDEVCAEMLLKAGAKPDEPDLLGVSARKYAAIFNKPGMIVLINTYVPREDP
ncbi:MAG: ankyrin repeat domain-containing protein [Spirochaetaceae bacterium]|nr:ankyrin repeat domain-containing protein [Spirochaetaceae bacterium]